MVTRLTFRPFAVVLQMVKPVEEAIAMAKNAIQGCLEVLKEGGQFIPPDDSQTLECSLNLTTELV